MKCNPLVLSSIPAYCAAAPDSHTVWKSTTHTTECSVHLDTSAEYSSRWYVHICILCSRVENRGGMTKQSKRRICNERNERVSTFVHVRETGEHPLSSTSEKRTNVPPRLWSVHRFVALWIHLKGDGPRSDFNKPGNSNRRVSLTQNGFLKRPNYNIAEQWWGHQCNPCKTGIAHFHFTLSTSGLLQWLQSSTPLMHRCGLAKERWPDTCIILPWD